jgi:hypothetical protein
MPAIGVVLMVKVVIGLPAKAIGRAWRSVLFHDRSAIVLASPLQEQFEWLADFSN